MQPWESEPQYNVDDIWRRYKQVQSEELRNQLMVRYLSIVKYNADRVSAKLPDEVEHDDLFSAGVFGLMDAIDSFDLDRGVKFETYCTPRIRGAILDELRAMDWVPRLVRSRATRVDKTVRELEADLGRAPCDDEIASRMRLNEADFQKIIRDAKAISQVSLSRKHYDSDSNRDVCEVDVIEDKRADDPVTRVHRSDLKELITRGLSRAEKLILVLYYYEALTMKEIGLTLDLSESRVSQMHSVILERLKIQMKERRREMIR
jgi:RNA polymerase sigma factor for flagellar operon FliA